MYQVVSIYYKKTPVFHSPHMYYSLRLPVIKLSNQLITNYMLIRMIAGSVKILQFLK